MNDYSIFGSKNPRKYWSVFKTGLDKEGAQSVTICNQLKLPASDGKMRKTDVATAKCYRYHTTPSQNAKPFKQWMAQLGQDMFDEIATLK